MKILFLIDPLQNYVSDPLYVGLVRILGQDHVVHYPPKPIYYDPSAKLWFLPQMPKVEKTELEIKCLLGKIFSISSVSPPTDRSRWTRLLGCIIHTSSHPLCSSMRET